MRRLNTAMVDFVGTRVSIEEKRDLVEAARKAGMSVSDYVRRAATEAARRVAA